MRRGIGKSRRLLISAVVLALLMLGAWPGAAVRQAEASTPIKPRFAETPKIVEPADVTVSYGDDLKLDVKATVSDGGTLSYQWYTTDTNDYANGPITNPSPHASACLNGDTDAICEALTTPTIDVRTARVWYYFVVVTNTNDDASDFKTATTVSRLIKVTVSYHYAAAQPNFSQDLADQTVHVGDYLVLPASANLLNPHPSPNRPETVLLDRGILSYQWYSNSVDSTSGGSPIAGAIGPYYVAPTEAEGTTYYYVEVTNTNNNPLDAVVFRKKTTVTSRVAKVTVNPAAPPSSGTGTDAATPSASVEFPLNDYILRDWSRGLWTFLNMGDDSPIASVAATVTDGGTLSYQWYRNTVKSTSGGSPIAGATDPYYIVPTTMTSTRVTTRPWAETTYYYVVVTNTNNNVSGTKTATATSGLVEVNVVAIVDASKPIIDTQPADLTVDVNDNASLSVVSPESADRQEYRRYQWYRNENNSTSGGSLIVGATSASYDVPTTIEGTVYYYVDVTNFGSPANGRQNTTVTSKVAKVTVGTPVNAATPSIVTQPASTTAVNVGGSASLSVAATVSDSGTLSYQWYSNATNSNSGGSLIAGATGASYAAPTTTAGTTYYYVVVTNTNNSVNGTKTATATSNAAKVTVAPIVNAATPSIATQPASTTAVNVGGSASLSVAATVSDSGTLSYQWYSNVTNSNSGGSLIAGATGATYAAPTTTAGTTYYYVVVTNTNNSVNGTKTATATSNIAKVTVAPIVNAATPSIATQPASTTAVNVGGSASLSVAATVSDSGTLSYQWYSNVTNSNSGGSLIAGATGATYAAPTTTAGTTYYYVVVTNTNNSVNGTKTATATSNAAKVTVAPIVNAATPSIATQPASTTAVNVGGSASLSVAATVSDSGTLSYQWYSNATNSNSGGSLIAGATGASYAAPTTTAGTTYYYVVVTNTNNSVNGTKTATAKSNVAKVTVAPIVNAATPSIATQPASTTAVNVGGSASLSVAATVSDSGTLSYQWYSNATNSNSGGSLIAGATGATYAAPTTTAGTTYYYVVVTNTNNSVNGTKTATAKSNVATVNVTREAQRVTAITVSSASDTLYVGDSLQFNATVAPNNAADKTFSWSVVPGTGAATISANGLLAATGAGTVTVQATAHDGSGVVGKKSITITNRPSGGSGGGAAPVVTKPVIDKNGVEHVPTTIDTTKPSVTLEVTPKDGAAYVSIPGSILTDLADKNANFFIEIKAPYGSYQVPVHLASLIPGLPDMMAKNGLKAEDISFKITVTDKSGDKDIQATLANNLQIGQVLGAIVDFHMDIVNVKTGQMIGKADKFSQALTRIIPMPKNMTDMPEQWGAFRYNETTKKLEFVPAKKALIDGVWYVTINSYSNSVYVVTKNPVGFTDTLKAWSKPYVELAAAKGLVQGVGDGKYDPDKAATRAEFTAMLVRALGRSAYVGSTATYEDVKQGAWYFDEIAQAKELGLLGFVKGTSFNPDQPLTREEMASMLAAAIRLENSSIARDTVNLNGYKDIGSVDAAYLEDVRTMVTLQIMNGISANTFDPKGLTSRAQAAVVFIRMLQSLGLIDK